MLVTRFAPSPTGYLHLGHAASALAGWRAARQASGCFLLRIEDIDRTRCRPAFEAAILEDLAWLGLDWEEPVRRQSDHMADYGAMADRLDALGVLHPCLCPRKEIEAVITAAASAPHGPDGPLYPGSCRSLPAAERTARMERGFPYALRLDAQKASDLVGPLSWIEEDRGVIPVAPLTLGDAV